MIKCFYLIVISFCLLLTSCQSDNAEMDAPAAGTPMAFSTRGGAEPVLFSGGERVGIFVTKAGEALKPAGNPYDNALLTYQNGAWSTANPMYYPNNQSVDIYTYMPYQDPVADVNALPLSVAANQAVAAAYKSSDFLWGKATDQGKSKEGVVLSFGHAMSRAEVKVLAGAGMAADDLKAALLSVKLLNQKTAAHVDLATGVVTLADGVAGEVSPVVCGDTIVAAIVVPQAFTAGTDFISLTLAGQARTYKLDHDITFTAGKVKRFNVTVSKESLTVSVVDVKEWESYGTLSGSAVLKIAAPQITEGEAADGNSPLVSTGFGVYLFSGTDQLGENLLYKTSAGGEVSTETAPVYYPTAGTVNLYAYAPYVASVADMTAHTFTVKADQSGTVAMNASDLLTAKAESLSDGAPVALTFAHRMSRVVVNLVRGNGVTVADMAAASVSICNTALSAKVNLKDGAVTQVSGDAEVIPVRNGDRYEAILVPQPVSGESFVKISIRGVVWVYKPETLVLKQGSRHTLNITVANSGITVAAPVVSAWNDEEQALEGEGVKIPRGTMMDWSGGECQSEVWSKVVGLEGDMLLVAEKTDKTYVYVHPKGYNGVILEFDAEGMPGRVITVTDGEWCDLAIFFPIEIGSVDKLGMGFVTTDRQIAILEPEVMPAVFKTGKLSAKIQEVVKRLATIVRTNGMEQLLPPAGFGFGSALINTLGEVDLEHLPSFADNGEHVLEQCGINSACELVEATDAVGELVVAPGGGDNMLETTENDYGTEVELIKDGSKYGFGDIKVTLKWDCTGDVDLHLKDPEGHYIYYRSTKPTGCDGSLDVDNRTEYGPENIFYPKDTAPQGTYRVQVDNYDGKIFSGGFTLFIYAKGKTKTYSGVVTSSAPKVYFTFDLNGNFADQATPW